VSTSNEPVVGYVDRLGYLLCVDCRPGELRGSTRLFRTSTHANECCDSCSRIVRDVAALEAKHAVAATESFSQGARCGHIEGRGRAGLYCIGEEELLSFDAADAQGLPGRDAAEWAAGYRHGYKSAAQGLALELEHVQ